MSNLNDKFGSTREFKKSKGFLYFLTIFFSVLILIAFGLGLFFVLQSPEGVKNVMTIGSITIKSNHVGAFMVISALIIGLIFYKSILRAIVDIITNKES